MFIRFNYKCRSCGHEEERFIKKADMDNQWCPDGRFHTPGQPMDRLPAAPVTHFKFNDTNLKR